jgi:rSAM/selenodomain-associated transferase 1
VSLRVVVFVKVPEPGRAKTRLSPALGDAGAAALAERLLEHAAAEAVAAAVGEIELCVAPDARHPVIHRLARRHGASLADQGEGDLGQRMHRAFDRALSRHDAAMLMGSDAPALTAPMLRLAATALRSRDAVLVPALDGGYVLIGLRRAEPRLFSGITWSTTSVLGETRDRLRDCGLEWIELPAVPDIDTPADLVHLPPSWAAG